MVVYQVELNAERFSNPKKELSIETDIKTINSLEFNFP